MEPQTPEVPAPPTQAQSPEVKPSNIKSSLLVIMAVCLLIATSLAALFYFQIQKLSKELSKYQTQPSPTPTATTNPTANWKTYKNDKLGFELQYPTTIEFVSVDSTGMWISGRRVDPYLELNIKVSEQSSEEMLQHDEVLEWEKQKQLIAGVLTDVYSGMSGEGGAYPVHAFTLQNTGKTYYFYISTLGKWEEIDQILSTFKFTTATGSAKPTPTSKACTLEAKVCPDGSSVGRTGPNCEFAPCP